MWDWLRRVVPAIAALACSGLVLPVTAEDADTLQKELTQVRSRIEAVQKKLADDRARESALAEHLQKVEKQIGKVNSALRDTETRVRQTEKTLQDLRTRQAQQSRELALLGEQMSQQIRAAYALGRQERLKLWLSQEDPAAVGRVLVYHQYLTRARAARIDAVTEQLARLAETEAAIAEETRQLGALRSRSAAELAALRERQAERRRVLDRLRTDIRGQDSELANHKKNERRLEQLVSELQAALDDIPRSSVPHTAFDKLRNKLPWPVKGRLTARYGERRSVGNLTWRGVFIETAGGTDVRAVSHGRVAFADWLRGFGLLLIIDHGDGYMSLYGHNQALYKAVGEWVETGDVVAAAGDSGGMDRTGLYFELRHRGQTVNPLKWCAGTPKA
jgi:septal ring factor EnvC (AmiA/AmiB activator)